MPRFQDEPAPRRTPWYWWGLVNLLALCFAVISWTLAVDIFGRPEVPSNYSILRELGRATQFKEFSPQSAPDGRVLSPPQIYGWYFDMEEKGYAQLNSLSILFYMRNFDLPVEVTYVEGNYEVLATRPLGDDDFISNGVAVRARALVRPDDFSPEAPYPVYLELILPTANKVAQQQFKKGSSFSLSRAPHLPVVMHVARITELDEPAVQVTVLPIGYGRFHTPSDMTIKLEVPEFVNPSPAGTRPLDRRPLFPLFEVGSGTND